MAIELAAAPLLPQMAKVQPTRSSLQSKRLGAADRIFFTEQLALLLETGASLHEALIILSKQARSSTFAELCQRIATSIEGGGSFSAALEQESGLFDQTYIMLIRAGEGGGYLQDALLDLLIIDQRTAEMQRELRNALTYPAFLLVFSLGVVVFVLTVVFPQFAPMFVRLGDELPWSTTALMGISNLLSQWWYLVVAGLVGIVVLLYRWLNSPEGRRRWHTWQLTLPVVRLLYREIYTLTLMRVLGASLGRDVPLIEALAAASQAVPNEIYRDFIGDIRAHAESGAGLADAFRESAHVPDLAKEIIATGEKSGRLAEVCRRLTHHFDSQIAQRVTTIGRLAEPIMLVVMGGIVGLIVASLILPVFKLSGAV